MKAAEEPKLPESANHFKEIVKGMISTYVRKNHDYGNSFEVSMNEEGLAAARIRLGDKWLRFKQLSKGKEALVKDEEKCRKLGKKAAEKSFLEDKDVLKLFDF